MRVTTEMGEVVQESSLNVNQAMLPVEIRLPFQPEPRPPAGGVSVQQLQQHPPATKAYSAFVTAQHFSESRRYDKAAEELEKALKISPDYADAHSNLAAQYTRLNRYEDALAELERAAAIAGPNTRNLANRAFALEKTGTPCGCRASLPARPVRHGSRRICRRSIFWVICWHSIPGPSGNRSATSKEPRTQCRRPAKRSRESAPCCDSRSRGRPADPSRSRSAVT